MVNLNLVILCEAKWDHHSFLNQLGDFKRVSWSMITTQNMIFSVAYYLELRNAIFVYCASHFLPTMVEMAVWTL